jgi:hypothetical protein
MDNKGRRESPVTGTLVVANSVPAGALVVSLLPGCGRRTEPPQSPKDPEFKAGMSYHFAPESLFGHW